MRGSRAALRAVERLREGRARLLVFVAVAIALGALLRLVWLPDMEYKGDERWSFERSQRIGFEEPWPTLGMPSSLGLQNPAPSVWIFVALARIFGAHNPVALDRAVVLCNVSAFVVLFAFVVRGLSPEEGEPWLWGLALAAVNPMAVLLERKIWAQSVLPIFCAVYLIGWLRRDRWWGAGAWGLVGVLLGQIHMSGFFFSAGFVLWELIAGRTRMRPRKVTQVSEWVAGTSIGAFPLVYWVRYLLTEHHAGIAFDWRGIFAFRFYRLWWSDTLGLGLDYSLGRQYLDFLRYPIAGGGELYPALYLQGLSFGVGVYVAACAGQAAWRWRARWRASSWREAVGALEPVSEAAYTAMAALVGYGLLLTLPGLPVRAHYMIVTFPLEWTAFACVALACVRHPRRWLSALWTVQLALALAFVAYIHEHHGADQGDYGRAFQWQSQPQ